MKDKILEAIESGVGHYDTTKLAEAIERLFDQEKDKFAVEFSEWMQTNRWYNFTDGKWNYTFEQGTSISKESYNKRYRKTTAELLQLFKNR